MTSPVVPGSGIGSALILSTPKRPGMMRADLVVQGNDVVQAFDGESGWMINPFMGSSAPAPMDPVTEEAMVEQSDLDGPLVGWEEDGLGLALLGTETVAGSDAYAIEVTFESGQTTTYFLDGTSYLIVRVEISSLGRHEVSDYLIVRVESDRPGLGKTSTTLSDYREVDGIMMPFSTNSVSPQGDQAVAWETIEFNVEFEDSMFRMPDGN